MGPEKSRADPTRSPIHMRDAAHAIRFAGNEAAHGDLAEEPITPTNLMDAIAILLRVYQEPAQVEHVRERRKARSAATGERC